MREMVTQSQQAQDYAIGTLEQFILSQVDTLDNITAVLEHAPDVLRVDGAREVRVAVVPTVAARRRRDPLQGQSNGV